jgi:hypothetical protein
MELRVRQARRRSIGDTCPSPQAFTGKIGPQCKLDRLTCTSKGRCSHRRILGGAVSDRSLARHQMSAIGTSLTMCSSRRKSAKGSRAGAVYEYTPQRRPGSTFALPRGTSGRPAPICVLGSS